MVVVEKISDVAQLLVDAAHQKDVVGFRSLHSLFDEETHENDVYDTLEAASRALCPSSLVIYGAVMAKKADGCPGSGFYDIINNLRREEFREVTGHNDVHRLTKENRQDIAEIERDRVYRHAEAHF
jgi:hypothetical protein